MRIVQEKYVRRIAVFYALFFVYKNVLLTAEILRINKLLLEQKKRVVKFLSSYVTNINEGRKFVTLFYIYRSCLSTFYST